MKRGKYCYFQCADRKRRRGEVRRAAQAHRPAAEPAQIGDLLALIPLLPRGGCIGTYKGRDFEILSLITGKWMSVQCAQSLHLLLHVLHVQVIWSLAVMVIVSFGWTWYKPIVFVEFLLSALNSRVLLENILNFKSPVVQKKVNYWVPNRENHGWRQSKWVRYK